MLSTASSPIARALTRPCRLRSPAPTASIVSISSCQTAGATKNATANSTANPNASASMMQCNQRRKQCDVMPSNRMAYSSLTYGLRFGPTAEKRSSHHHRAWRMQNYIVRTNFSYAGPRKLTDILKTELIDGKSSTDVSDLWMTYHEAKEKVHGLIMDKEKGKTVLERAAQCPFFIHPVFRDEGHFMIVSQFQPPHYFLLAFLEDYQMDPARAQPLLTVSIFDDLAEDKGVNLVRCDIINQGIEDDEGYKICKRLLDDYANEDDFRNVHMFNTKPDAFNVDDFVKEKESQWKE